MPVNPAQALPRGVVHVAEQQNMTAAKKGELLDKPGHGTPVVTRQHGIGVLVERREGRQLAPGDRQGTETEDPLRVDNVPENLAHTPLAWRISEPGTLIGNPGETFPEGRRLMFQERRQVQLLHK